MRIMLNGTCAGSGHGRNVSASGSRFAVRATERDAAARCCTARSGVGLSGDGVKPGNSRLG